MHTCKDKQPNHECAHSSWMRTYMHIYIIAHFMLGDLEKKILPQCKMTSENINDIVEFVYMWNFFVSSFKTIRIIADPPKKPCVCAHVRNVQTDKTGQTPAGTASRWPSSGAAACPSVS